MKITFIFIILVSLCSCQTTQTRVWTPNDLLIPEQSTAESLAFPKEISEQQEKEDIDSLSLNLRAMIPHGQYRYFAVMK